MNHYDVLHFRLERHEDEGVYYTITGIEEAIITDGESIEEVLHNLKEAVEVHLNTPDIPRLEVSLKLHLLTMAKQRRLNGKEIIRAKGSHFHLGRIVDEQDQLITVPVHGTKIIKPGTLKSIYNKGCEFISEDELHKHFYTD